jgi:prepilin-type processing-associated H-X9-DG protein
MGAAQMYAEDNAGRLPGNYHGGEASGSSWGWARGWLDWSTAPDNTNIALVANERYASLAVYLQRNPRLFKCPADVYLSSIQRARGWTQRVRTYSVNIGVGEGNAETGPFGTIYKHIKKTSEFIFPAPSENWVYTEEHPDSINDPAIFAPQATTWVDLPGVFHEGSAAFAFADGHAVVHRWIGSLTRLRTVTGTFSPPPAANKDPDIHWMSYGAGRLSTYSY